MKSVRRWPLLVIAAPAAITVWSGWVQLGELCGFGVVHPLPGIDDQFHLNTAITLPIGVEAFGAYAIRVWLRPGAPARARRFAMWALLGSLLLGGGSQATYHLIAASRNPHAAPAPVIVWVSVLAVLLLGMAATLVHLMDGATGRAATEPLDRKAVALVQRWRGAWGELRTRPEVAPERVAPVPVLRVAPEPQTLPVPATRNRNSATATLPDDELRQMFAAEIEAIRRGGGGPSLRAISGRTGRKNWDWLRGTQGRIAALAAEGGQDQYASG